MGDSQSFTPHTCLVFVQIQTEVEKNCLHISDEINKMSILFYVVGCEIMIKEDTVDDVVVAIDRYPTNLTELVQYAMTISGPGNTINLVALNVINILIMNMDIYLYLENKFNLEENLTKIQNECFIEGESKETTLVIDECSSLRQEILIHIKSMATPRNMLHLVKKTNSSCRRPMNELNRFLKETKHTLHDNNWMAKIRKVHKLSFEETIKVSGKVSTSSILQFI